MKRLGKTRFARYLAAMARTVHPIRAIFEVCGTILFAIPFLAGFAVNRSAPLYLYLLYPLLFLVSHFVWFRLPSVDRRVRWILFWVTLTLVAALGAGFIYWSYLEAVARGARLHPLGIFAIPHWVSRRIDVPFPTVALYFLAPSAAGAAVYCAVLALFLRIYRRYRVEEHHRRTGSDGTGS
ncbi:MAG TPA: hypothetical protein VFH83_01100 [Spirochaetia bacterium]|nr:hypothetical protein [Spirochaetia bacterium]